MISFLFRLPMLPKQARKVLKKNWGPLIVPKETPRTKSAKFSKNRAPNIIWNIFLLKTTIIFSPISQSCAALYYRVSKQILNTLWRVVWCCILKTFPRVVPNWNFQILNHSEKNLLFSKNVFFSLYAHPKINLPT